MTIDVVFKAVDQISQSVAGIEKSVGKLSGTLTKFGNSMLAINQSIEAFDRMGQAVDEITAPFREFEQSMAELSSITGIVCYSLKLRPVVLLKKSNNFELNFREYDTQKTQRLI